MEWGTHMTKRSRDWVIIACASLVIPFSCAGPDGMGVGESPNTFDRASAALDRLADSYEKENVSGFMSGVSGDYDLDYSDLGNRLRDEFDRFDALDLSIIVDRVSVDSSGTVAFADTHWIERRVSGRTGREGKVSGRTTFIFRIMPDGSLVLKGMKGDRVFGSP